MELLRDSFLFSPRLWLQMKYLAEYGTMHLLRDHHLIFHGCIPCDQKGNFLSFPIDGQEFSGKALFEQLHLAVQRSFRERRESDLDLLWYLWGGARSPLFGKDKMATFETYLIGDKETHKEIKNPYFSLIHEASFCDKILKEFGADPSLGLIVNGHVPVKIEAGESPIKRSGKAVTIDGAFSEAYGDRGYTLVLGAERTTLAQHHHFDSVRDALESGTDIIPSIGIVREFLTPRTVSDTERGEQIRHHIDMLRLLIRAYQENRLRERL
jgi:fructose-1,6-bisphosphatase-3